MKIRNLVTVRFYELLEQVKEIQQLSGSFYSLWHWLKVGPTACLKMEQGSFERRTIVINDFTYKWLMEQKRRTEQAGIEILNIAETPKTAVTAVLRASLKGEDKYYFYLL